MAGTKIVVIEDSESEVFLLRRALALQSNEYDLEVLTDGERALAFIDRVRAVLNEIQPCVILLDLRLPKHDGIEVLKAVRNEPGLSRVEILVTSNGATPSEEEELRSLGASYRLKPRNLAEFAELANDLMSRCTKFIGS